MRANERLRMGVLCGALLAGCHGNANNENDAAVGADVQPDQTMIAPGVGTCDTPVDLNGMATRSGSTLTIQGTTAGGMNVLHPSTGCAMTDDSETVFRYAFASGVDAIRVSTEGSAFDTVLYARTDCMQSATTMDLACNNDSFDHAPQSLLYVTHTGAGSDEVLIVVDGTADAMGVSSGAFTLTVTEVALGSQNAPCRVDDGMSTTALCDGTLLCSQGGAPDGTAICVPPVPTNAACDIHGFANTCTVGAVCAADPSPPDGTTPPAMCSMPGTHAGALCRMTEPRCDAPLVCGTGDAPICVRALDAGAACDITGSQNACGTGLTCRATSDAGDATCSP